MELKILQWNANSLPAHGSELKHFISQMEKYPDVICIQETWFNAVTRFSIDGYNCERHDRTTGAKGGGVATFIKTGISYSVLNKCDSPESIAILLTTSTGPLAVTNVYHPPGSATDEHTYPHLFQHQQQTILVGDFNAYSTLFGAVTTDTRGQQLENCMEEYSYVALNTGAPTYIQRNGGSSHLDLALATTSLAKKSSWTVLSDSLGSDHLPCLIAINERVTIEDLHLPKWLYKRANWDKFKTDCKKEITPDIITEDIEASSNLFVELLQKLSERHIPKSKRRTNAKDVPYWTDSCTEAVNARNKAKTRMQRTKNPKDIQEYRRLKALAQKTIRDAQKSSWRDYCTSLNDKTKVGKTWNAIRRMSGVKSGPSIPTLKKDGRIFEDNLSKAELFGNSFSEVSRTRNYSPEFQARKAGFEEQHKQDLHEDQTLSPDDSPLNETFDLQSLRIALQKCKKNTSPGEDGISYEILVKLPQPSLQALLKLYNLTWDRGILPFSWKRSVVTPILKPNKPAHEHSSYRPIALTSVLCKVMERLVCDRLSWHMDTNGLFNRHQSGFRRMRCCQDHIIRLQDDIQRAFAAGQTTTGVFIDLEKAFDLMWTDGLLYKLQRLGIQGQMFKWIRNFLSDRSIRVRVGASLSRSFLMENGSPQGSVISPVLFIILLNDIPEPTNGIKLSLYADDSAIWRSSHKQEVNERELQRYLDTVKQFFDDWGFKVSTSKTVAVQFQRGHRPEGKPPCLKLGTANLAFEKSVKFLGMVFDRRLDWTAHLNYIVDRCKPRLNLMRAMAGASWGASKETLLMVYRAMIRSIIDYGSIAYDNTSSSNRSKLDTMQYKALSICCGALRGTSQAALQVDCGEMPLHLRRRQQMMEYTTKIQSIPDHPTQSILKAGKRRRLKEGREEIRVKVAEVNREILQPVIHPEKASAQPPWTLKPPVIELHLRNLSRSGDSLQVTRQAIEELSPDALRKARKFTRTVR